MSKPILSQANRIGPVALAAAALATAFSGCTGQLPSTIALEQRQELFNTSLQINTKVDILWVVDNSASMDQTQDKLRAGFASFATKYMQPTWDIRTAVIPTDTYLANPAFSTYLNTKLAPNGFSSAYINSRLASWVNPASNPTLLNTSTGKFDNGIRYKDLDPLWGPNYALLQAGIHDGPTTSLCFEWNNYFIDGATQCKIRDDQTTYSGTAGCLNPNSGLGESAVTQCVNTVENDTVHSGRAIIETKPPVGVAPDAAYTQQLIDDFTVNVTTGTAGHGSERGMQSVLELLSDNEISASKFFRQGSIRVIIFVSDEEDQSLLTPSTIPAGFTPFTQYACDKSGVVAANPGKNADQTGGYCCTSGCAYGAAGTSCPSKTVDGYTYTPSICPIASQLIPVSQVKDSLDSFFLGLDGAGATDPNYFVVSIVPLTATAIQTMQALRDADDAAVGALKLVTVDRGDRYMQLGNLVGNGSVAMNIADTDYSPILDAIGRAIATKTGTFLLARAPTSEEDMAVQIVHEDGSATLVPQDKFVISGKELMITDLDLILSFDSTDKILINYEPKTLN
jgi:hypothetical protein